SQVRRSTDPRRVRGPAPQAGRHRCAAGRARPGRRSDHEPEPRLRLRTRNPAPATRRRSRGTMKPTTATRLAWSLWAACVGMVLPVIFPTGSPTSKRWGLVIWFGIAGVALLTIGQLLQPGPLDISHGHFENPIGIAGAKTATSIVVAVGTVLGAVFFAAAI